MAEVYQLCKLLQKHSSASWWTLLTTLTMGMCEFWTCLTFSPNMSAEEESRDHQSLFNLENSALSRSSVACALVCPWPWITWLTKWMNVSMHLFPEPVKKVLCNWNSQGRFCTCLSYQFHFLVRSNQFKVLQVLLNFTQFFHQMTL